MLIDLNRNPVAIDFAPANEMAEIIQNIRCLFNTLVNTCPYYRDFGLSDNLIDAPITVARARFANEFVRKINLYEPRVKVTGIEWPDNDVEAGKLAPIVKFKRV